MCDLKRPTRSVVSAGHTSLKDHDIREELIGTLASLDNRPVQIVMNTYGFLAIAISDFAKAGTLPTRRNVMFPNPASSSNVFNVDMDQNLM